MTQTGCPAATGTQRRVHQCVSLLLRENVIGLLGVWIIVLQVTVFVRCNWRDFAETSCAQKLVLKALGGVTLITCISEARAKYPK